MKRLKIIDRGFEIVCLCAFRYAVDRHATQSMTRGAGDGDTIEDVILDNLDHICSNFKCQMMRDITNEYRIWDSIKVEVVGDEKVYEINGHKYYRYSPHYLDHMLNALKKDYADTHGGTEWKEWMQS